MRLFNRLSKPWKQYCDNAAFIRRLYGNRLKQLDQVAEKDRLERTFYDCEAEKFLSPFDEERFTYHEDEPMPLRHLFLYDLLKNISGKRVLDCCCGHGIATVRCAKRGAIVTGIDISPGMLELSRKNIALNQVGHLAEVQLMSVQAMSFPDNTFDCVVGLGALHHLNLELAGREVARVLRPGGTAIFLEPRLANKWLATARSVFPAKCVESPGGGGLTDADIKFFASNFASYQVDYFILLGKLAGFRWLARHSDRLDRWDEWLVRTLPFLRKGCWAFVLQFVK